MLGEGNEGSDEDTLKERKVYSRRLFKGLENSNNSSNFQQKVQAMVSEGANPTKRLLNSDVDVGGGLLRQENILVNLSTKSKRDALELRRKLESERDMVRSLMKKIEAKEGQKNVAQGFDDRDGNTAGVPPRMLKPVKPLTVSVHENSKKGSDNLEKEKRTPKANKMYRNSEFLLAKDRIPASESNKKLKSAGKKGGKGMEKFPNQVLKNCGALLEKLMKHKHGWVFNKPVDAVALGLHDYFEIIKKPMDLGTVKDKLIQNCYKVPSEFAEDVRLVFQNAMTYNPKGQDVYVMAEQMSKMFEDKWGPIETEYKRELKLSAELDMEATTPTSRKVPQQSRARPESSDPKRKKMNKAQLDNVHVAKKPKAKDLNKREMTFDEKQKLSINLQELPSEKLENVVQIIKKRNPSVSQQDDEIEVDIDSVDTETLWELDRFITNFKKNLSKNKNKTEIVGQLADQEQNINGKFAASVVTETARDEEKAVSPPAEIEEPEHNDKNRGVSQSSSSSDSGSSSSDSEGEST